MSWFNRHIILTFGLFAFVLTACGFTPAYGPGGGAEGLRGSITIAEPSDADGYTFVKRMEERLGRNLDAPYRLDYTISSTSEGVGVTPRQEITRTQILGSLNFTVTNVATGTVVDQGVVSNFTSYSTEGSTVSTATVERDAERRLMVSLADLMVTRFIASYSSWEK